MDLYRDWAMAVCFQKVTQQPSRAFAAGIINLRPDRDGHIVGCEGMDEVQARCGEWMLDAHVPPPGAPTQPVSAGYMANAWIRMRHPDYDELRTLFDWIGTTAQLRAR
jgi:hypothetical protein